MPVGYLVTAVVVALATLLALSPPRRPPLLASLAFRLTVGLNELPFVAVALLLASTLLAFGQHDVHSAGAWATVGLVAVTLVGLVLVVRRGLQARPVVDRALSEGLGVAWRTDLDPALADGLRDRPPLVRIVLRPVLRRRHDVVRVANISYGDAGRRNLLDVYRPRSRPLGGPTLIHLHGGHFRAGRKNTQSLPLLYRLASRGWVCISANYRLAPTAHFPDHLIDAKKVIAWVRQHGHEHGADPAVLFVAGTSAGAHLAAMAALTPNDPTFQPGFEDVDTSVTAAIGLNGYYGPISDGRTPSTPLAYVGADAPPFFVAHGDGDTVVPVEAARQLVDRLRGGSDQAVVYVELPGAQHAFDLFHSLRFEAVVDGVEAFASWVRSPRASQARSGRRR